jgi:hypothetical protein
VAISVWCKCGKLLRVKDELAGRKVRCPECQGAVVVPPAVPTKSAAEADDAQVRTSVTGTPGKVKAKGPPPLEDAAHNERPKAKPVARKTAQDADDEDEPPPRSIRKKSRSKSGYSGFAVSPSIVVGALMMLGAIVWFCAGMALDIIFFYPPIMFVLGLISFVKGLMGRED